jgi:AraC-like DNA-binding protein
MVGNVTLDSVHYHRFPIRGIESMAAATERSYPRHTHDQYGIGLVDFGTNSSWSDRGQVEAGPGHFICVNPGEVHDGTPGNRRPRRWRMLYFDPALLGQLRHDIAGGGETPFTFVSPVFFDAALRPVFDRAFSFAGASPDYPDAAMACEDAIIRLVAHLGVHSTSPAKPFRRATARISRVRERIDADPSASVTIAELANEVGLNRYQLMRGFSRELRLTPHAYVLQRRLELARSLIKARCGLAEAAMRAGFCDQSHLTRCFLRQFGVTPRLYALASG